MTTVVWKITKISHIPRAVSLYFQTTYRNEFDKLPSINNINELHSHVPQSKEEKNHLSRGLECRHLHVYSHKGTTVPHLVSVLSIQFSIAKCQKDARVKYNWSSLVKTFTEEKLPISFL